MEIQLITIGIQKHTLKKAPTQNSISIPTEKSLYYLK